MNDHMMFLWYKPLAGPLGAANVAPRRECTHLPQYFPRFIQIRILSVGFDSVVDRIDRSFFTYSSLISHDYFTAWGVLHMRAYVRRRAVALEPTAAPCSAVYTHVKGLAQ